MANDPAPAPAPAPNQQQYDPKAHYDVVLKAPITIGDRMFRPGQTVQLRGDVMNANANAIASSVKVRG